MVNRKTTKALKLAALPIAALLACTLSSKPAASLMTSVIAQASSFSVPDSVPKGTNVQVSSSSDNMNSITEALKGGFETQYSNARVSVETKDANAALQDVRNGNADLAAISRPLTAEEEAQGLVADPVRREKIAIIVGENNPFAASITGSQFAQIFRGEITNWQEVGGPDKAIRLIDRPEASETRQSLQPYPVFVSQPFETGSNATQVSEDSLDAIANELGDDGISYALVGQLEGASNVKAVQLHQTLPDDPRYPFSQPYSFVYAGGASPAVEAFLGYATNAPGQAALNSAKLAGYSVAPATAGTTTADSGTSNAAGTDGNAAGAGENADGTTAGGTAADGTAGGTTGATIDPATGNTVNPDGTVVDADGNVVTTIEETETVTGDGIDGIDGVDGAVADGAAGDLAGRGRWWWLLLPLAGLGLLIWAASKRGAEEETGYVASTADRDDGIRTNYRGGAGGAGGAGSDGGQYATSGVGSKASTGINRAVAGGTAIAGGAAATGAGLAGRAANRAKGAAGDVTTGLGGLKDGVRSNVQGGIDSVKGSAQDVSRGGLGNLRSNIQGGVDSVRDRAQGGIDGAKGNLQGGIDGIKSRAQDGIDGVRGSVPGGVSGGVSGGVQGGIDSAKTNIQGRVDGVRDNIQGDVQGGIDSAKTNLQGGVDGAKTRFQGGVDNMKGNMKGATSEGGSWLDRAKQRINDATDQVKDTASDIKDDVTGNDSNR